MASRVEGRMEKRVLAAVRLELTRAHDGLAPESAITENLCSLGVRIITRKPMKPNEQVKIRSSIGHLLTKARVIYCHPQGDGRFAVGLRFDKAGSNFALAASGAAGSD